MSEGPYVPSSGVAGKARRLVARRFARHPLPMRRLERPIVSVTFDDFPLSAATSGKDALERRGWRGTYFASGCYVDTVTHLGPMYRGEDLSRLAREGHEIGCHTYSHLDAGRAAHEEVLADVQRNAEFLRRMGMDADPTTFAYPYGETSPAVKTALARRFRVLRSVQPGINRHGADRARLRAVGVDGGPKGIAAAVAWIEQVAAHPGWLVYYLHDVQDEPTFWGCTRVQLDYVLDAVAASGAEVLPVGAAFDRIAGC